MIETKQGSISGAFSSSPADCKEVVSEQSTLHQYLERLHGHHHRLSVVSSRLDETMGDIRGHEPEEAIKEDAVSPSCMLEAYETVLSDIDKRILAIERRSEELRLFV